MVIVPARQATFACGIHSLESIPRLHKRLKIRAQCTIGDYSTNQQGIYRLTFSITQRLSIGRYIEPALSENRCHCSISEMLFVDVLLSVVVVFGSWLWTVGFLCWLSAVISYKLIVAWFFVIVSRCLSRVVRRLVSVVVGGRLNFWFVVARFCIFQCKHLLMFCPKYKLGNTVTDE
jgi:hypothetical protein